VLQVLADQLAIAIENGRLFARQERVAQLEQQVAALTTRIHGAQSLEAILNNAATELGQMFGARKVVVRLTPEPDARAGDSATAAMPETTAPNGSYAAANGGQSGNGGPSGD
jgi:GAF domain-containing protein